MRPCTCGISSPQPVVHSDDCEMRKDWLLEAAYEEQARRNARNTDPKPEEGEDGNARTPM
jgi:hypothetical protein